MRVLVKTAKRVRACANHVTKKVTEEDMIDAREALWPSSNASLSSSRLYLVQVHRDLFTRRKSKHGIIILVPHNARRTRNHRQFNARTMNAAAAANRWRRHGHHRWTNVIIGIVLTTEEDVSMFGHEDW